MYDLLKKKLSLEEPEEEPNMSIGTPAEVPTFEDAPVEDVSQPIIPTSQVAQSSSNEESIDSQTSTSQPDIEPPIVPNMGDRESYFNELYRKSVYERPKTPEFKNAFDNKRVEDLLKEYDTLSDRFKTPQDTLGENLHGLASTLAAASGNDALANDQRGKATNLRVERINKLDRFQDLMKAKADLETKKQDAQNEIEQLRFKAESQGYLTAAEMAKLQTEQEKLSVTEKRLDNQMVISNNMLAASNRRFEEAQGLREDNADKTKIDKINSLASEYRKDPTVQAFEKQGIAVGDINTILDQSASGNKSARAALGIKLAKAYGEVGAMSDRDVTAYVKPSDWRGNVESTLTGIFDGTIPLKQGKDIRSLINLMQKNIEPRVNMIQKNYAQRAYESYGKEMKLSPEDVELKMGFRSQPSTTSAPLNKTTVSLQGKTYRIDTDKLDAFKLKYPKAVIKE
jgi:hypothetical protein